MLRTSRQNSTTSAPSPDAVPTMTSTVQTPEGVQSSLPVFKTLQHNVMWHLWTFLSVATAIVLLYLNFTEHIIGPELGRTKEDTTAVLNILLFVAKGHEIAIVLSLANLARQLIQSALISKKGTILALVGAEQVTATPSVLVSNGYASALKYGLRYFRTSSREESKNVRGRRLVVLTISGFLLIAGILCATVGPSSAVLMIPEQHWFLQKELTKKEIIEAWNITSGGHYTSYDLRPGHPYIFISPLEIDGAWNNSSTMYWNQTGVYWSDLGSTPGEKSIYTQSGPRETHHFDLFAHRASVNSSTSPKPRPLLVDEKWTGGTTFTTLMYDDVTYAGRGNITYKPGRVIKPSPTRFVTELTGLRSTAVCRRRRKLSCTDRSTITPGNNGSDWCFEAVTMENPSSDHLFNSQDLLLLVDRRDAREVLPASSYSYTAYSAVKEDFFLLPRFYITEGIRTKSNNRFTDSILFVFEFDEDLVVCANTVSLTSATATLSGKLYSIHQAHYHRNLSYYDGKTHYPQPSATLLFREGWLDYEHALGDVMTASYTNETYNGTIHSRHSSAILNKTRAERGETQSVELRAWADKVVDAKNRMGDTVWRPLDHGYDESELERVNQELTENDLQRLTNIIDASAVELVVGGPWITMMSALDRSPSQYMLQHDNYSTTPPPASIFDPDSLIEPIQDYRHYDYSSVWVYHLLYGYSLMSSTVVLAVAVMMVYMVVAICGSIWQLCRGGNVIIAWGSVPEYLLAGERTATELGRLGYADVGGKDRTKLECGVRVDRAENSSGFGIKLGDVEVGEAPVR